MFYDYTKLLQRNTPGFGVPNYNLTYSYSGENKKAITTLLYNTQPERAFGPVRAAVVFLGYLLEDGTGVRVKDIAAEAPRTEYAEKQVRLASRPKGAAGYGYGLPTRTDVFAPDNLKGTPEGMLLVTNADRHDARPLDPPNEHYPYSTIAGLIFKSPGGGQTLTASRIEEARKQRETAFVTPTLLVPGSVELGAAQFTTVSNPNGGRTARINGKRVVGILIAPEAPRFEGPPGNAASFVG
jgi:hypothetical protein